ncbi:hypothetical protein AT15_04100 [Kosmotoga arenicorallina S304]|uniref:tRNA threonylcarbamoyladenosine biosynthesis protein TsaE n=1 Tax=Kosmotoga arenicorallina S304 TaxID=1453497 RepID=A0A176JZ84_9BACT|nr:tRNA (adenosine(37)-N6)-threonylcarbamoyltransferase complex ATPase subunit type 1 TsaE [Kosmotoga arenicorallina]OAA29180.1 hypothetical protein AT15_04100 [Kosmotoga arenicorallina S304]
MERSDKKIYELGNIDEITLRKIGKLLGLNLTGGEILLLYGNLGTGKTTFVKGLAEGMGIAPDYVRSPTFTLVNMYPGPRLQLIHADFYRLDSEDEIEDLGFEELLDENSILAIEWPEKLKISRTETLKICLYYENELKRKLKIETHSERLTHILAEILSDLKRDKDKTHSTDRR